MKRGWYNRSFVNGLQDDHGHPVREHLYGWQALLGWAAILVSIISGIVVDRISIEHRLSEPKVLTEQDKAEIGEIVSKKITEADANVVEKDDLQEVVDKSNAVINGKIDVMGTRLSHLEEGDRYNRRVLSNLDLTAKPTEAPR